MNYIENNGLYYRNHHHGGHNHGGHNHNGGHHHHGGHNHHDHHHHHGGGWGWGVVHGEADFSLEALQEEC